MKLIRAVWLPAHCSAVVPVQAIGLCGLALLEPKECLENCLKTDKSLMEVGENGSITKKLFFPEDPAIQVHQSHVRKCPPSFPNDFYWYGGKRSKAGRPPKRVLKQLEAIEAELQQPGVTNNFLVPEEV